MLASLDDQKLLLLRLGALESEYDLFGGFGLLVEDGFGLSSVSGLFSVVTTFSLSVEGSFTSLVLGDFESRVLVQLLGEGFSSLWYVDHTDFLSVRQSKSDSKMG